MNDSITLNQFLTLQEGGIPKDLEARLEFSGDMATVRDALQARGLNWEMAWSKIIGGLDELLNISLEGILVKAWKKYQELRKYRDNEKYPPNETYLVHLVEHTIRSVHRPYLAVLINGIEIQKIEFAISLALTMEGAVLKIRDGKIKEIMPGACKGKGTLSCGEFVLMEQKTRKFVLPASISLGGVFLSRRRQITVLTCQVEDRFGLNYAEKVLRALRPLKKGKGDRHEEDLDRTL